MSGRPKSEAFKKGDVVRARWTGSNVFYDAKVLEVFAKTARVQFDDGSTQSVKIPDIKKLRDKSEKSPSPKTAPKLSKSRSRSRSTGRTRSRSRSPARKATQKRDTRRSKSKLEPEASNSVSRDEADSINKTPLTREKIGPPKHESTSIKSASNSYSREINVSIEKREGSSTSARGVRSARIAAKMANEAIKQHAGGKDQNAKSKGKYSDAEEEESEEDEVDSKGSSKMRVALCFFYTLCKILVLPSGLLFLAFACTKKSCSVLELPQFYSRFRDFANSVKIPFAGIAVFHAVTSILSLVPLGRKMLGFPTESQKRPLEYRFNGFLVLLCYLIAFGACTYFKVNLNFGYDKFRPIALSAVLYCILCAVALHLFAVVRGGGVERDKSPYIGKFYHGSFINPIVLKKVDVKTSFIRFGFIGAALLNLSILHKYYFMKSHVTIPLGMTAGMQLVFILDLFLREEKLLSTAIYTFDTVGYGFILKFGFLVPIGMTIPLVYLFNFDAKASLLPHWCSAAIGAIFIIGYYIYLRSTNVKHNFRRNPFDPSVSGVVSAVTGKKKRLIISPMWGVIRHPNYIGLFLIVLAWTLPCGFAHAIPFGPLILLTISIVLRTYAIEEECREKYGPAWKNYAWQVPKRLLPYVF